MEKDTILLSLVYEDSDKLYIEKVEAIKDNNGYKINSVPAFAKNLSFGDLVKVSYENGEYFFEELIDESGHSTIHIAIFNSREKIIEQLTRFGCGVNTNIAENYLVVDVPPVMPYFSIRNFLDEQRLSKTLDYREACVSKIHKINHN